MSQVHSSSILRSVGAVVSGLLAGAILSLGTDMAMEALGFLPRFGQPMGSKPLLLATVYRTVYGIVGSYVAARLAPGRPMKHALILGFVGLIVCIVGAAVTWNKGPAFGPHWYPVALVVLALPTAWLGGMLRVMQVDSQASKGTSTPSSSVAS